MTPTMPRCTPGLFVWEIAGVCGRLLPVRPERFQRSGRIGGDPVDVWECCRENEAPRRGLGSFQTFAGAVAGFVPAMVVGSAARVGLQR